MRNLAGRPEVYGMLVSEGSSQPVRRLDSGRKLQEARLDRAEFLSPGAIQQHQNYYNRTLAHIDELRSARHPSPDSLFTLCEDDRVVERATTPQAQDGAEQAEIRAQYQRFYRSLQRELARGTHQRESLGSGQHRMAGGVRVEVCGVEVTTLRPDGNWRCADLRAQTVWMGGPQCATHRLRKEGCRVYRDSPTGWERYAPDPGGQAICARIPANFHLEVVGPGGVREKVEVHCRAKGEGPGEVFEVEFKGRSVEGLLEVVVAADLASPMRALEGTLHSHLTAMVKGSQSAVVGSMAGLPVESGTDEDLPKLPRLVAGGPARVLAPLPESQERERQTARGPAPAVGRGSLRQHSQPVGKAEGAAASLTGKPPAPLRLRLESGVKVTSTPARMRKARKLAARLTRYEAEGAARAEKTPARVVRQVALRLAAFCEETMDAFEKSGLTLVVLKTPPKEWKPPSRRPLRVPEEALFQPFVSEDLEARDLLLQALSLEEADH